MGDEYAEVFSEILKYKKNDYALCLKNNRLSQAAADKILKSIGKNINKLDFSYNPLIKDLNTDILFSNLRVQLVELNLEGNKMGDSFAIKLSEYDHQIKNLNLSHNLITNKGAISISNNLHANRFMIWLNLSWNNIQVKGAIGIWEALNENKIL